MFKKLLFASALVGTAFAQDVSKAKTIEGTSLNLSLKQVGFEKKVNEISENTFSKRAPESVMDDSTGYYFSTNEVANQELGQGQGTALPLDIEVANLGGTNYLLGGSQLVPNTYNVSIKSLGIVAVSKKNSNTTLEDATIDVAIYNKDYSSTLASGTITVGQTMGVNYVNFTTPAAATDTFWVEFVPSTLADSITILASNDYSTVNTISYNQFGIVDAYDVSTGDYLGGVNIGRSTDYLLDLVYDYTLTSNLSGSESCGGYLYTIDNSNNTADAMIMNPIFSFGKWRNDLLGETNAYYGVNWGDGGQTMGYLTAPSFNYSSNTTYNVTAASAILTWNGNFVQSIQDLVADFSSCQAVGIEELTLNNVSLYPNPASTVVNINFGEQVNGTVRVLDLTGRTVAEQTVDGISTELNVADFNGGLYIFQVEVANNIVATGKFNVAK